MEDVEMMREGRLQRVREKKKEFLSKKEVTGIMEELLVRVKEYRTTEMTEKQRARP